jgi:hypothetical protein
MTMPEPEPPIREIDRFASGPFLGRDVRRLLDKAIVYLRSMLAEPRDEYHTMTELYDYRMLYNAMAARAWARYLPVVKSWRHSDGELCFGGGWFVVVMELPTGQVTNHYAAEHWDLFGIPEDTPPEYDGHTPEEAADRMRAFLRGSDL